MADLYITIAGFAGMIGALLWRGVVPYMEKRKEAQMAGETPPTFSGAYLTNFIIAVITGFITTLMTIGVLEESLVNITSVGIAAGMGFSFTYTVLGITNRRTDAVLQVAEKEAELKTATATAETTKQETK